MRGIVFFLCFSTKELFTFHEAFFNASRANQRAWLEATVMQIADDHIHHPSQLAASDFPRSRLCNCMIWEISPVSSFFNLSVSVHVGEHIYVSFE